MKKSLTINATRAGKKVSKNIGYVNPDVANSLVGGFAQMVNALTTDTFVNAEVVKKMDTSEEEQAAAPAKQIATITFTQTGFEAPEEPGQGSYATVTGTISYNGDGTIYSSATGSTVANGSELSYTMNAGGTRPYYVLYAKETDNFSAAVLTY